jgi:hypothetical protein
VWNLAGTIRQYKPTEYEPPDRISTKAEAHESTHVGLGMPKSGATPRPRHSPAAHPLRCFLHALAVVTQELTGFKMSLAERLISGRRRRCGVDASRVSGRAGNTAPGAASVLSRSA